VTQSSTRNLTSGIGHALACKYAETGTHVVAVGRRQEQLDELANKYEGKISTKIFDISKLDKIPQFVEQVVAEHPDLECVFLNRYLVSGKEIE
jgi:NADP-dependent 3-hydroxy acid dehydrogenase YdfG